MSMLTLTGQVINVFETPAGVNKKGEEYESRKKIQLLGSVSLKNGDSRQELIDLTTDTPKAFSEAVGRSIRVPVGVMASGRNVIYYIPKGSQPEFID